MRMQSAPSPDSNVLQGVVTWRNRMADVLAVSSVYGVLAGALSFAASPMFALGGVMAAILLSHQTSAHLPHNAKPVTRRVVDHFTELAGLPSLQIAETDLYDEEGTDTLKGALAHAVPNGVALSKVFAENTNLSAQAAILGHEIGHHIYGDTASRLIRQGAVVTAVAAGTIGVVASAFSVISGLGALALLGTIPVCHLIELAHTRQMEQACDRGSVALTGGLGLTEAILWRATVMNDTAEPSGLKRLAALVFTRHHPFTFDRIAHMQDFLATLPDSRMAARQSELQRIFSLTGNLTASAAASSELDEVKPRRFAANTRDWRAPSQIV